MAAMVAFSATAFAQDDLVKEAEKLSKKGSFAEAITTITPALTSEQTLDKAKAWNVLSTIYYNQHESLFAKQQEEKIKGQPATVTDAEVNVALANAFDAALKCDEYDMQPNEKGKVKPRFRSGNASKFSAARPNLAAAGQVAYNSKEYENARRYWKLYVDTSKAPIFSGIDMSNDQYLSDICYYVAFLSYQNFQDYPTAIQYAKLLANDSTKTDEANEIILFASKDGAKTKADSLAYLQTLKDFHKADPAESRYFNLLMEYYSKAGDQNAMMGWINEEITLDPNNKMAWALKGEAEMNAEKYDDAIVSYQKALEIDPEFIQVIFNVGVCMNSKAFKLKEELADKNTGGLTKENADKVKVLLNEAKTYLLKTKEMDPNREKVNWVYPLYQIYYALGDEANSAEMEKLLNGN